MRINIVKFISLYDRNSVNVIWVLKKYSFKSILNNNYLNDIALIKAFCDVGVRFRLKIGCDMKGLTKLKLFYNISKELNYVNLSDHNVILYSIIRSLEEQGNYCFPSSGEVKVWENKKHMHKLFEMNSVNSPTTYDSSKLKDLNGYNELSNYPYLVKESHSAGGSGIYLVNNFEELISITNNLKNIGVTDFLIQERIEMRRDLRIIVIGNRVVLHYWRINTSAEWKITSTREGSQVDFEFLPAGIEDKVLEYTKLLNLSAAAFDVTYANDDFSTEPIILEVSPAFMPNPKQRFGIGELSYSRYKKLLFRIPNYSIDYVNIVMDLKLELLNYQLNHTEILN